MNLWTENKQIQLCGHIEPLDDFAHSLNAGIEALVTIGKAICVLHTDYHSATPEWCPRFTHSCTFFCFVMFSW